MNPRRSGVTSIDLLVRERDLSLYGSLWVVVASLGVLTILLLPGCSDSSRAHAVDVRHARDAIKIALDQWKKGDSPRSLASSSTPMIVQDFEWQAGAKLLDYQLIDDGKAYDANLRIQVKLTLTGDESWSKRTDQTTEKKVWYLVGTTPAVTVFRDPFRR